MTSHTEKHTPGPWRRKSAYQPETAGDTLALTVAHNIRYALGERGK